MSTPKENYISVQKTARYFTLGELNKNTKQLWLVLHGYGYHAGFFIKKFEPIIANDTYIVAPEGLSKFYKEGFSGKVGASWMTKEDRLNEIEDQIFYLNALTEDLLKQCDRDNISLNVLGFSQGGATLVRWLNNRKIKVDNLILWATSIPHDFDYEQNKDLFDNSNNYFFLGKQDPFLNWISPEELKNKLEKYDVDFTINWFEGEHDIPKDQLLKLSSFINSK